MTIDRFAAASYGVQYVEGPDALSPSELAAAPHEALILEPLNHATGYDAAGAAAGRSEFETMQAGGKQVFLYLSVGETSDLRSWWDPAWTTTGDDLGALTAAAPDWISGWFSGASGGQARLVKFWTAEWLEALKGEIEFLIGDLGADGLFLDNVASYFEWLTFDQADSAADPSDDLDADAAFYASAMSDLVVAVSAYARSLNPDVQIIANGDPFLPFNTGDFAGKGTAFLDAISAMLQEGVYHSGGERVDNAARAALKDVILANGVPVLALDYVDPSDAAKLDAFARDAVRDGFLPYAEGLDLALDGLAPALNQPTEAADRLWTGPSTGILNALGGDDEVTGSDGADRAELGAGHDTLHGGGGDDVAVVSADRAAAFVSAALRPDGAVVLTLAGALGVDVLHDVESVAFADGTVPVAELLSPPGPNGAPTLLSATTGAGRIEIEWRLDATGEAPLPAGVELEVSLHPAAGGSAVILGRSDPGPVAPGGAVRRTEVFEAPPGAWRLGLVYDPDAVLAETDETDNAATPLAVDVPAPPLFTEDADAVVLSAPGPWDALGGDDAVTGTPGADTVAGGAGHDTLAGRDGADSLTGGKGRDSLAGGDGDDALDGSGGADRLEGGDGSDVLRGGAGRDDLFGGRGDDDLEGGGRDDFLVGAGGSDRLDGGAGADEIEGNARRDRLLGGGGQDALDGGAGRDTLDGGRGDDTLKGGGGRDVFVIGRGDGDDRILDFGGRDALDLTDFGFSGARQVLRRLDRDGGATELSLPGGGEIEFGGLRPKDFDADDFLL